MKPLELFIKLAQITRYSTQLKSLIEAQSDNVKKSFTDNDSGPLMSEMTLDTAKCEPNHAFVVEPNHAFVAQPSMA